MNDEKVHLYRQISGQWIEQGNFDSYEIAVHYAANINAQTPDTDWKIEQFFHLSL